MSVYTKQINDMMKRLPESEQQFIVEFVKKISDSQRLIRNAEYLAKLDRSVQEAEEGKIVMYTRAQMRAMETEAEEE